MYNAKCLSLRFLVHSIALVVLLSVLSQAKAAPLPSGLNIDFNFGPVSGLSGPFVSQDSYNYAFNSSTGSAPGALGVFDNTTDKLLFDIAGSYSGDSQNAFIAPVTLTLSNTDPLSLFNVVLDVSYLVSARHSGFGFSSVALINNGGLVPLDSAEADDPFFGFSGDVTNKFLDVSGIPSFSVGTTPVVAELALVFEQFHTGPFFGPEFSDYSVHGEIGIGQIKVIPIAVTEPLFLILLGIFLIGWQRSKFT